MRNMSKKTWKLRAWNHMTEIDFADTCEGNSMTLKASSFPGQSTKVILPLTKISEKECYCPTYENGTQLALIRYPHAGTFEIPIVTVNNKNVSGKRNFGNIQDAIGINSKVAERLSGADFDGDTVVAIPISSKVAVKATAALRDLKDFDPKTAYAVPEGNPNGVRLMKKEEKQKEIRLSRMERGRRHFPDGRCTHGGGRGVPDAEQSHAS